MVSGFSAITTLLVIAGYRAQALVHGREDPQLSPPLSPKSDHEFFKKDYPYDGRPAAHKEKWTHPYPSVQASQDFDKDFVKDENGDNGEWAAQMEYDRLQNKVHDDKQKLKRAKGAEEEKGKHLKEVEEKEKAAEKEAKEKKDAEEKAEKEAKDAEKAKEDKKKEESDRTNKKAGDAMHNVEEGAKTVAGEVASLQDCEEELKKAKERLHVLLKESEEAEAKEAAAEKKAGEAVKAEQDAEEREQKLEHEVDEEEREHNKAYQTWEEKDKAVKKMEVEMSEAEAQLKKFRQKAQGANDEKSGALRLAPSFLLLLVGFVCMQA